MKRKKSKKVKITGNVPTQTAAARRLGVTTKTLRNWRAEGAPGFHPDGRVDLKLLSVWIEAREVSKTGPRESKEEKLMEEIRKLRIANDAKEGTLISRAWMAERVHIAAGKVDGFRHKSESEHPLQFAACADDVSKCRELVRKIWDEVMTALNSLAKDFEEPKKQNTP